MAISSGPPPPAGGNAVTRYLTSNKNLAGSAAGLAALGLHFVGIVGGIWPLVLVGMYGAAALAMPERRRGDDGSGPTLLDTGQIRRSINDTVSDVRGKVPDDIYAAVVSIRDGVFALFGRLDTLPPGSQEGFIISRMATDYLPSTINPYLSLPQQYANTHRLGGGKTAHDIVLDQLQLLSKTLDDVTNAVLKGDADQLLANGRFLEQRFGGSELDLKDPSQGAPVAPPMSPPAPS